MRGFTEYLDALVDGVTTDDRVLGLVGLGSTALERPPDRYSDHDVWLVVVDGSQDEFRRSPWWLPEPQRIVLWAFETEHGRTAMYDDGHLVEAAVFAPDELSVTRANHARVFLDRERIAERVAAAQAATTPRPLAGEPGDVVGRIVFLLVVGSARHLRGERLSGHRFVKEFAVDRLLALVSDRLAPAPGSDPDGLDPWRRVEESYPVVADSISEALTLPTPQAARSLLDLVEAHLGHVDGFPEAALAAARRWLGRETPTA
jgi:hypothetical protein